MLIELIECQSKIKMDKETRVTLFKRKLEEKREELEDVNRARAKKMKENVRDANILEAKMKDIQDKIDELQAKKNCIGVNLKKLKKEIVTFEEETDKKVSKAEEQVQLYQQALENEVQIDGLRTFIDDSIKEKEEELECPVCLETASAHIYMCQNSHLVCGKCLPKLSVCPECGKKYPKIPKRHRYAEKIVDEVHKLKAKRDLSDEEISLSVSLVCPFKGVNEIHYFKVKKTTKMSSLKNSYSAKVGIPDTSLNFRFRVVRINGDDTPESLGMEENDEIDAFDWQEVIP